MTQPVDLGFVHAFERGTSALTLPLLHELQLFPGGHRLSEAEVASVHRWAARIQPDVTLPAP
ncbi:MAG: hypothetical protein ABR575_04025 [Actinomycetota bacterium]